MVLHTEECPGELFKHADFQNLLSLPLHIPPLCPRHPISNSVALGRGQIVCLMQAPEEL